MSDEPLGQILDWDSAFFGCRVARATITRLDEPSLAALLRWCEAEAIEWLYFLADPGHRETPRLAREAGFDFVDLRLELIRALDANIEAAPPLTRTLRPATPSDLPALRRLAAEAHRDTRYYFDLHLGEQRAQALYVRWIERSVLEAFTDIVLVADWQGQAVGYITGKMQPGQIGLIGLLAVGAGARGRGVGSALVQASLAWFAQQGAKQVTVVTQGRNVSAQRLYQRQGFVTQSAELWYHKWFPR